MKLLEMGLGFEVPLLYNKQERNFNPKEGDMMEKKEVVIAGAGKIGRGYLAELFREGGYHLTFLVHNPEVTHELNRRGSYLIFRGSKDEQSVEEVKIDHYTALCTVTQQEECVAAMCRTPYVMLPVYPAACADLGRLLAQAINRRAREGAGVLDIYLCVNFLQATKLLRACIEPHLEPAAEAYYREKVGVIETLVGRLCVEPTAEMKARDPLSISAGYGSALRADADAVKGEVPPGVRIELQDRLPARFTYKIWTTNMRHFALSLYGDYLGYTYVREAAVDPYVQKCVREQAYDEAVRGVAAAYGLSAEEVRRDFGGDPWPTWANPASNDGFARVVADMRRKLSRDDRVIGPAMACLESGHIPFFLASVAALAMIYDNEEDASCRELHEVLDREGVFGVLREFSGLNEEVPRERQLMELIQAQYISLLYRPKQA